MGKWMILFAAFGGALAGAATAGDLEESPAVPSGYPLYLQEFLLDAQADNATVARFRFVMPEIGQKTVGFADVEQDFQYLCDSHALPALARAGQSADQVIISLSDRETVFGVISDVATQFFEAYSIKNGTCIWEGF